ncbi:hypothetical protein [Bavariicoccus seileri]|uniref:hypothetical protein n=1 Tax=Bavariicoccus seileri TaxID=549685 RepID=UPI0003B37039|nr:hypothetical protein [Bavariicoccus seileri]
MAGNVYIHYDMVSNQVLLKGLPLHKLFLKHPNLSPHKLLLLDDTRTVGTIDPVTKFTLLEEREDVEAYFSDVVDKIIKPVSWVDYQSKELVQQLTPPEIAELLYLNHIYTPMRSPFFYKLQNNMIFLALDQEVYKIYQRHLNHFYVVLNDYIVGQITDLLAPKFFWQSKPRPIQPLLTEQMEELLPLFREGMILSFDRVARGTTEVEIAIFMTENIEKTNQIDSPETPPAQSKMVYDFESGKWHLALQPII